VARKWKANPFIWKFLTADIDHLKNVLVNGFKVPIGNKEYSKSIYDIAHSEKIVLVDQIGNIRGYYKMEKNDINRMMIDLGLLANNAFSSKNL
jgi:protein SCO1/2